MGKVLFLVFPSTIHPCLIGYARWEVYCCDHSPWSCPRNLRLPPNPLRLSNRVLPTPGDAIPSNGIPPRPPPGQYRRRLPIPHSTQPPPTPATHHSDSPESPPTHRHATLRSSSSPPSLNVATAPGGFSISIRPSKPSSSSFPKMSKSCLRLRRKTPIIRKKKGGTKRRRSLGALSLHIYLSFSLFIFLSYLRALLSCEQIHSHPIGCARIAFDRAIKRA